MIKSVTIKNYLNNEITLELTRPEDSGFVVRSIDGLGPAKATINVTDISTNDGGIFNSSRLEKRNIVFDLLFLQSGNESIEDIRQKTYKYFPIKKQVTLTIATDNHTSETVGYVESNEPDIFSQNEGCSISIICPDPFFYSAVDEEIIFSGVEPMFEFPFANDSVTTREKMDSLRGQAGEMMEEARQKAGELRRQSGEVVGEARQKAGELLDEARGKAGEMMEEARQKAGELRRQSGEMVDKARGKAGELGQQAGELLDEAREKMGSLRGQAGEMMEEARHKAEELRRQSGEVVDGARQKAGELLQEARGKAGELGQQAGELLDKARGKSDDEKK